MQGLCELFLQNLLAFPGVAHFLDVLQRVGVVALHSGVTLQFLDLCAGPAPEGQELLGDLGGLAGLCRGKRVNVVGLAVGFGVVVWE